MADSILITVGAGYGLALILELIGRLRFQPGFTRWSSRIEWLSFALFSLALIWFFWRSSLGNAIDLRRSMAWIFFAWALGGADLLTRSLYQNVTTGPFTKIWVTGALALVPILGQERFIDYFSGDFSWLTFTRLVFITGYAFYFLGLPLAVSFLWNDVIRPYFRAPRGAVIDRHLLELDRLHHNTVLWALPLLSLGLISRGLMLFDSEELVSPTIIAKNAQQEFFAIVSWLTCALYLHTRIFFRWRYNATALVYLGSLVLLIFAQLSGRFILSL